MWAFVLYDKQEKNALSPAIVLAKTSITPKTKYHFVFCSEVKGIYASGLVEKAPNKSYLKIIWKTGANEYDAETAFENVYRFPLPTTFFGGKEELLNQPKFIRYWELTTNTSKRTFLPKKSQRIRQAV